MSTLPNRYDRNIRLFGKEGQLKLQQTTIALIGVGGLGSAVAQHLALLGVGRVILVDNEELDETNRNRFIGARNDDPVPGSPKVLIAGRLIHEINPDVLVTSLKTTLTTAEAFDAVKSSDWVFGCFDSDGPRFVLNELCSAYVKPYIDLASDVPEQGSYGGRVCTSWNGNGCLSCLGMLDAEEVRRFLSSEAEQNAIDAIYGVPKEALDEVGPAVSPINGVVASLATTEFMAAATGMREPTRLIEYRGHTSKVVVGADLPNPDCYYCKVIRGNPKDADVDRYLDMNLK